ncbi:hypothetical protein SteCoe_18505 [Stentor coeruleus]|uniref:MARVEL domain-containing protein n=1 Tax=Stentor coeruleus TaxID=5963 RepID=A0A1R2BW98_9CILI|nr:hypothetical protein SteCoe_18505 [Stentor coeruleus]
MQKAISQSCTSFCCYLGFIIAIGVILNGSDKNCENPIREWLIVWIVVSSAGWIVMTIERILGASENANKQVLKILRSVIGIWGTFSISWMIVGSIWLYNDDICKDHFYDMWALTLAILIISYIGIGCCLFACCCAMILLCVKGKPIFKKKEEKPQAEVPNSNPAVARKRSLTPSEDPENVV